MSLPEIGYDRIVEIMLGWIVCDSLFRSFQFVLPNSNKSRAEIIFRLFDYVAAIAGFLAFSSFAVHAILTDLTARIVVIDGTIFVCAAVIIYFMEFVFIPLAHLNFRKEADEDV
jgi:hypothetical protein